MHKIYLALALALFLLVGVYIVSGSVTPNNPINNPKLAESQSATTIPNPSKITINTPQTFLLKNDYHVFQTFNNCGPAALSMALSYYGINESQEKLGRDLRPYQHPKGDNDDKSVTLEELAEKSKEYGLIPFHRPAGNIEIVEKFIANGMPVITRTLLKIDDDIGHYRVIKGYDRLTAILTQDDSLQGKNLTYSYSDFTNLWATYNNEYLVLVPQEKLKLAETILQDDNNEISAWKKAMQLAQDELNNNPYNATARFNLSVALYHLGEYKKSVEEFEKVEDKLSFRTLWYQIEPILSYKELGQDSKVLEITQIILGNQNKAFSELYLIRGEIFEKQGKVDLAKSEYEKAIFYNVNFKKAQQALDKIN